ncbi:Ppx/GppA family phosphatase [Brachybacterium sp. EF45031]|uniref:Ppx/GppA phosphatase family protein n=1 Tax=Brachybacterium sillae TaxID=2810536 RepID=UPI00217D96E8|nr:Ppx/GppA phosphatase family protein [Brachybacterium sillae]MCS6712667.1 Ppx/GppA family phosphatase [Brachybacterium sillae]
MSRTVAAVDCGTNSIRLLIARQEQPGGPLVDLERHMEVVRLGYGVDRTGVLDPAAIDRTLDACRRYARLIAQHQVEAVRFVATSATRDASNREAFVRGVREILGVDPEVISGDEEARLSFRGAVGALPDLPEGEILVVDIGGGSTELVLGRDEPTAAISLDLGSVRLTERCLPTDPPTPAEIDAARAEVDAQLDRAAAEVPWARARALVGVAGTVTTLTALALNLEQYRPEATHGASLPVAQIQDLADTVLHSSRELRAQHGAIHPGRIDVIGAGALIWSRIIERVAAAGEINTVRTSERDILDGIAQSALERLPDAS